MTNDETLIDRLVRCRSLLHQDHSPERVCIGANAKHPTFSVKRTSAVPLGEAVGLGEASVSE
jgi:hypothetical protein